MRVSDIFLSFRKLFWLWLWQSLWVPNIEMPFWPSPSLVALVFAGRVETQFVKHSTFVEATEALSE
jgi:hypothetical protein